MRHLMRQMEKVDLEEKGTVRGETAGNWSTFGRTWDMVDTQRWWDWPRLDGNGDGR